MSQPPIPFLPDSLAVSQPSKTTARTSVFSNSDERAAYDFGEALRHHQANIRSQQVASQQKAAAASHRSQSSTGNQSPHSQRLDSLNEARHQQSLNQQNQQQQQDIQQQQAETRQAAFSRQSKDHKGLQPGESLFLFGRWQGDIPAPLQAQYLVSLQATSSGLAKDSLLSGAGSDASVTNGSIAGVDSTENLMKGDSSLLLLPALSIWAFAKPQTGDGSDTIDLSESAASLSLNSLQGVALNLPLSEQISGQGKSEGALNQEGGLLKSLTEASFSVASSQTELSTGAKSYQSDNLFEEVLRPGKGTNQTSRGGSFDILKATHWGLADVKKETSQPLAPAEFLRQMQISEGPMKSFEVGTSSLLTNAAYKTSDGFALIQQMMSLDKHLMAGLTGHSLSAGQGYSDIQQTGQIPLSSGLSGGTLSSLIGQAQGEWNGATAKLISDLSMPLFLRAPDVAQSLTARIHWMMGQSLQTAEILLDPPELGQLQVKIQRHQGETSILFQTSNVQAREIIQDNLPKLKEMLQQQGLHLADANVRDQSADGRSDKEQASSWSERNNSPDLKVGSVSKNSHEPSSPGSQTRSVIHYGLDHFA